MAFTEALKPKPGSKHLSVLIDADGKEIQAETRDDELQKIKYDEIISILVAAGYFRAKIKGLSEFDKVVGGMTWCLDICNVDLDIDLLFRENSTIGQKISLTEKIVTVLGKMECPFALEPHQIQGLDFIHIHPVIEWLVKRSLASRAERGDFLRSFAVHQFDKWYRLPNEQPLDPILVNKMMFNIKHLQAKYGAQRKFKRKVDVSTQPKDRKSRIESTLFEYGHAPVNVEETADETVVEILDEARREELSLCMTTITEDARLGPEAIKELVNKKAEEVTEVLDKFNLLDIKESPEKKLENLRQLETSLEEKKSKLQEEISINEQKLDTIKNNLKDGLIDNNLTAKEIEQIDELESLLLEYESLKQQETQFKETCKNEYEKLQEKLKEAEEVEKEESNDQLTEELNQACSQLAEVKLRLAKATRQTASVQHTLDSIPTRPELSMYQKRFIELYNQVNNKHRETKQYYTLYNSLSDQQQYLYKELSLLNSILDSYSQAMQSPKTKDEFIKQMESIVDGIKQNKAKVEQKRNEERDLKEKLKVQLQSLIDEQRLYAAALKEFTEACKLSATIVQKLKSVSTNRSLS